MFAAMDLAVVNYTVAAKSLSKPELSLLLREQYIKALAVEDEHPEANDDEDLY